MTSPSLPAAGRPLSILIVNPDVPPPDRDAGSLRLFRLLELLATDGHRLTLVARAGAGQAGAVAALERLGVEVHPADPERASFPVAGAAPLDLEALVARVAPDVAWLSFYETAEAYLPLLRRWAPGARVAIDTVDVHSVREARAAALSGHPQDAARARQTREREQAIYGAADALVAVSADDAAALAALAPAVPVSVVGLVHPPEPVGPPAAARDGAVFVGNFRHAPNVDAAVHLVTAVWPHVRAERPGATLRLVGTAPPPAVQGLAGNGVEVTGWVPETAPYLRAARVSVAPLRFGAGVKGKIGEALAHGLPVVTTTVGAEGMDLVHGEHVLIADAAQDLAAAIVALHDDDALWERLSRQGRAALAARLSPAAASAALRTLLASLAPATFVARGDLDAPGAVPALLAGYLEAFAPQDPVSLVVPLAPGRAPDTLYEALLGAIAGFGHDPEAIPDVAVTAWAEAAAPPSSAIVAGGAGAGLGPAAPPAAWRAAAAALDAARPDPAADAAVVVRLPADTREARAQLTAVLEAGMPAGAELVLAVADGQDVSALRADAPAARIVRHAPGTGRRAVLQRAVRGTPASVVVTLEPHALPAPGCLAPLVDAIEAGAVLAGPVLDGVHGLRVDAADGTLWPLAPGGGAPDALPLDVLAAARATWLAMPMALPSRGGHAEAQLGAWATARGTLAVAPEAVVHRAAAPPATVIICTRDRAHELSDVVELVVGQGAAEVLVVDNGSGDATPEVAAALAARHPGVVRVVDEPDAGLSRARNAGARAATHDLLVYLDDDARPAPGWLAATVRELARDGVACVGGPIVGLWPQERSADWPAPGLEPLYGILDLGDADRDLVPPDVVYGGNWSVRRAALAAAGGFDPGLGVGPGVRIGGEEVGVAWRLHRDGLGTTRFVAAAAVGHRIPAARLTDGFLVHRALTVGLERPRHLDSRLPGARERLLALAQGAAQRLLGTVPLHGALRVEDAVAAITGAALPQARRTQAADALGELAACVALLGETEVTLGDLALQVRPEHLHGALDPVAA